MYASREHHYIGAVAVSVVAGKVFRGGCLRAALDLLDEDEVNLLSERISGALQPAH
ncbi:hypothetical protein [Caldimonas tepidiphila]|uniref:hypothetical protein n=1 Tax=Caldimonas tepidiphila TaxID=2315841 RepID=UPI001300785E|nr:hypothetical protein [Caldimonas tepidiphila]